MTGGNEHTETGGHIRGWPVAQGIAVEWGVPQLPTPPARRRPHPRRGNCPPWRPFPAEAEWVGRTRPPLCAWNSVGVHPMAHLLLVIVFLESWDGFDLPGNSVGSGTASSVNFRV